MHEVDKAQRKLPRSGLYDDLTFDPRGIIAQLRQMFCIEWLHYHDS